MCISPEERDREIRGLERQLSNVLWIQLIMVIYEAILVTQLANLNYESEGEKIVAAGVWTRVIGLFTEAASFSQQINSSGDTSYWKKLIITGVSIQSFGSAVEATGDVRTLQEDQQTGENEPAV
ncbi:hypothetical protein [Sutcliffiella rhizosphaerae]|uniref:Uncharacterized protein n=1 Tax=Sutcliffiella rhizosphaerae TaxID=2880967 RepID=A0ABM8YPV7_9BACI|nr:hypothetical protein [Sutcliffiella rhizosphaerae]CAG9621840.1 hypothetical protein BACCIP111883_02631 [Sutcliffiella rhizosphaerae]